MKNRIESAPNQTKPKNTLVRKIVCEKPNIKSEYPPFEASVGRKLFCSITTHYFPGAIGKPIDRIVLCVFQRMIKTTIEYNLLIDDNNNVAV